MRDKLIRKTPSDWRVSPNLIDYEREYAAFSWDAVRAQIPGLPGGGLNIAFEATDRHAAGPRKDHVALRWLGCEGARRDITYGELSRLTNRFAAALKNRV